MTTEIIRWATLTRDVSADDGTPGEIITDTGRSWRTGELPDRDNHPDLGCVPFGRYAVYWEWSNAHGCNLYHLHDVEGRTVVEIHDGNIFGDVLLGYGSDVKGCCLIGEDLAEFAPGSIHHDPPKPPRAQRGVTNSRTALAEFEAEMRDQSTQEQQAFWLTIQ